jgi:hypothetical protein
MLALALDLSAKKKLANNLKWNIMCSPHFSRMGRRAIRKTALNPISRESTRFRQV